MVLTTDLVDSLNDIHPKMKKEVAERLARMALADTYGKSGIAYQSPRFSRMEIVKNRVRLHFSDGGTRLASKGGAPKEFYIAGADKVFYPAQAKVEGNTVMVWSKSVPQPEAVRFAFTNAPQPNLYSEAGLPVVPFRTDNWDVTTLPAQ
jgi:sialate O-acetylesterase